MSLARCSADATRCRYAAGAGRGAAPPFLDSGYALRAPAGRPLRACEGRAGTRGGVVVPARWSGLQTVVRANAFSIRSLAAPLMTRSARAAAFSASVLPWAGATWFAYSVSAL